MGISEAEYERMVKDVKAKTTSAVESIPWKEQREKKETEKKKGEKKRKKLHLCNISEIIRKLIQTLRACIENIKCE